MRDARFRREREERGVRISQVGSGLVDYLAQLFFIFRAFLVLGFLGVFILGQDRVRTGFFGRGRVLEEKEFRQKDGFIRNKFVILVSFYGCFVGNCQFEFDRMFWFNSGFGKMRGSFSGMSKKSVGGFWGGWQKAFSQICSIVYSGWDEVMFYSFFVIVVYSRMLSFRSQFVII